MGKGYTQQHDIHYDETFAAVAKITTIRVLLVVATAKGWRLDGCKERVLARRNGGIGRLFAD